MSDDAKALQEFGSFSHPGTIADFLSTLSPGEAWNIFPLLEHRLRAEIFGHVSEELQIELTVGLRRHDSAQIITYMSAHEWAGSYAFPCFRLVVEEGPSVT